MIGEVSQRITMKDVSEKTIERLKSEIWYHGTTMENYLDIQNNGIQTLKNIGSSVDFGPGFYLGNSKVQAEKWSENIVRARRATSNEEMEKLISKISSKNSITEYEATTIPVVLEYKYDFYSCLLDYSHSIYEAYDVDFAKFVIHNRLYVNKIVHTYDITYGVVADCKPDIELEKYRNGMQSISSLINKFVMGRQSYRQICIHNQQIANELNDSLFSAYILNEDGTNTKLDVNCEGVEK
ncbi:MAG: DUF3990 domain-containing protein [Bacilli bacterium]